MSDHVTEATPALVVQQLRSIFLRPDVPLKGPSDDCAPMPSASSLHSEVAIAEHECVDNSDLWVELWATPNDRGHVADRWSVTWRVVNDSGAVLLENFGFCPFCGLRLDEQIDALGYYKYVGHDLEAEIAAHDASAESDAQP